MIDESEVVCSFCGKGKDDVERIIAGPNVAICAECVDLCVEVLHEGAGQRGPVVEVKKGNEWFKGDPCEVDKVTIGPFVGKWILESTAKEGKIAEGKKVLVFTEFGRMTLKPPSPSLFANKYYAFRANTDSLMLTALDLRSEWAWQAKFTESGKLILGSGQSQETYVRESNT